MADVDGKGGGVSGEGDGCERRSGGSVRGVGARWRARGARVERGGGEALRSWMNEWKWKVVGRKGGGSGVMQGRWMWEIGGMWGDES